MSKKSIYLPKLFWNTLEQKRKDGKTVSIENKGVTGIISCVYDDGFDDGASLQIHLLDTPKFEYDGKTYLLSNNVTIECTEETLTKMFDYDSIEDLNDNLEGFKISILLTPGYIEDERLYVWLQVVTYSLEDETCIEYPLGGFIAVKVNNS